MSAIAPAASAAPLYARLSRRLRGIVIDGIIAIKIENCVGKLGVAPACAGGDGSP